jgi:2-polyprenyl-3-methyl-5-hydroxy-6-metoxy-1,4-benzoquinol methylase
LRAIEVGCGLGLPSLVAALRGADVRATDVDPRALAYVRASSAKTIGRELETSVLDLRRPPRASYDLVLAADVLLYEPEAAPVLTSAADRLVAPGGRAIVACPWPGQADALVAALPARFTSSVTSLETTGRRGPTEVDIVTAHDGR